MSGQANGARKTILLVENIHPNAKTFLEKEGFSVRLEKKSPSEKELIDWLDGCIALGIRSKTRVTAEVLQKHPQLQTVGCFCIGTDQVDLTVANRVGVPVFNAPYSNTRSVAELVIAEIIALSRQLFDRSSKAHVGEWEKSAAGSREVRGKTLGIVGYGHIGSQVSVLAESLGLRVLYYDTIKKLPLGNSQGVESLEAILAASDFVSFHVPDTPQTRGMMSASMIQKMKKGAFLINASRGTVVDLAALAERLRAGDIGGAAIDVFPVEPSANGERFKTELQGVPNVILTPHIGGSTEEAQEAIGEEVAQSFLSFLKTGSTRGAVNFPQVDLPTPHGKPHRIVNIHYNVPGVLKEVNGVVSQAGGNVVAQTLSTDQEIGYLIMDVEAVDSMQVHDAVAGLKTSIRTYVL